MAIDSPISEAVVRQVETMPSPSPSLPTQPTASASRIGVPTHGSPQPPVDHQPAHHSGAHPSSRLEELGEGIKKRTAAIYHMAKPWHYISGLDGEGGPSSTTLEEEDPANNLLLALQQKLFENYHTVAYVLIIASYFLAFCEYIYLRLYSLIFPERVVYRQGCEKHANETIVRNEFHYASATVVFAVIASFQIVCFFLLTVSGRWLEVKRTFTNFISMEERLHNELAFTIKRVMFLTVVPTFLVYFLCSTVVACDIFYMVGLRDPVQHLGSQFIIYFYDFLVLIYFVTFPLISLLYHPDIGCGIGGGFSTMTTMDRRRRAKGERSKNLQNTTSSTNAVGSLPTSTSAAGPQRPSFGTGSEQDDATGVGRTSSPWSTRGNNFPPAQYSSLSLQTKSSAELPQSAQQPTIIGGGDGGVESGAQAGQPLPQASCNNDTHSHAESSSNNQAENNQSVVDGKRPRSGRHHKNDKALTTAAVMNTTAGASVNRPNLRFPSIIKQQRDSIRAKADRYRRLSETDPQQPAAIPGDMDEITHSPPLPPLATNPASTNQRSDDDIEPQ